MSRVASPHEDRTTSPEASPSFLKEDAQDRLPTRNSLQLPAEDQCLQDRGKKRRKIQLVQRSWHHSRRHSSTPTLEEAEQTTFILPDSLNQNQRLILKNQSDNKIDLPYPHPADNRTKRNKIFSHCHKPKKLNQHRHSQVEGENQLEGVSSTKRLSTKLNRIFQIAEQQQNHQNRQDKQKQRCILGEIDCNPGDHPTVTKEKSSEENNTPHISKLILSYPKFTPAINEPNQEHATLTPALSHSRILNSDHTHRISAPAQIQIHANPAAKKIKQPKHKHKRTTRCSFSKLSFEKHLPHRIPWGTDSHSSNCLLPECLIKDNLANYNIKLVESCSSGEEEGERYYDAEQESPIRQKISYRNIDIQQQANADDIAEEEGCHNLFSDFQFPTTPKREAERKDSKALLPKSNRKILPHSLPKTNLHFYLIGLAILMLLIQLIR